MSYKVRTIYTKPSAEVSLHTPPADYTNLINSYFEAGRITQKPVESIDGLTHTYTVIFTRESDFKDFCINPAASENHNTRQSHCNENSISYSIEQGV